MSEKKKLGIGKILGIGCLGIIGIFVLLGVIGAIVGGKKAATDAPAAATSDAPENTALKVTAAQLSAAFQANEAKAKLAFDGQTLQVTGVVKDIDLDFTNEPQIKLKGAGEVQGMGISQGGKITDVTVSGLSKEQAANIDKGQKLTVTCTKVDEVLGGPTLGDCSL